MQLNQFPQYDFTDPELARVRSTLEAFGRDVAEQLSSKRVKSWLYGPSPDGKSICAAIGLEDGSHFAFSFGADQVENLLGVIAIAARFGAEISAVHGEQSGNG